MEKLATNREPRKSPNTNNAVLTAMIPIFPNIPKGLNNHTVGTIKNNRNKKYSYAQVTFNLYDKNGAQLGSAIANINNLEPYGKWKYDAIGLISNPEEVASYKLGEIIGF